MSTATDTADIEKKGFAHVREQTEAVTDLQKNLLSTYEEIGEEWVSRLQDEANLWSDLMHRLVAARSAPELFGAYSNCLSQRLQMAGDDSQRVVDQYQRVTQQVADALNNGLQPWQSTMPWVTGAQPMPRKPREVAPASTRRNSRKRRAST
jgi:undecaprenyl pyrophosphate synthase